LNSAAIDCICPVVRPSASGITASGLPPNFPVSENIDGLERDFHGSQISHATLIFAA
jgi:hypothetical protein